MKIKILLIVIIWVVGIGLYPMNPASAGEGSSIRLWHSYRGDEEKALLLLVNEWNQQHPNMVVEPLNIPFGAFAQKLSSAIPNHNGPDIFIAAHERIGDYIRSRLIVPVPSQSLVSGIKTRYVQAVSVNGKTFGVPIALKSLALFYNKQFVSAPPKKLFAQLLPLAKRFSNLKQHRYGLAFEAASPYHAMPFVFGFGGMLFDERGNPALNASGNVRALEFIYKLVNVWHVCPEEANGALITDLFNREDAAFVINGPWFLGEISPNVDFGVAPLPIVDADGLNQSHMKPLLTVEAVFFAANAKNLQGADKFVEFLVSNHGQLVRASVGHQVITGKQRIELPENVPAKFKEAYLAFASQAEHAVITPSDAKMKLLWEPFARALRRVLRGAAEPKEALNEAQTRLLAMIKPPPKPANPWPYILLLVGILLAFVYYIVSMFRKTEVASKIRKNKNAYLYLFPTAIAMFVLLLVPFVVGSAISLFAHVDGGFTFVGLRNFWRILSCADYGFTDPLSFYFTLGVTLLWTVVNVALHVSIGVALALLLRNEWLKLKGVYRMLLIVPWAVPNYITALIWKGMFHKQMGAINALLSMFGVEPVSWFSKFSTAFAANVITNTWLGFPFMMVITLGALQSIPKDVEEAAMVDGANGWQRFWHVILPMLKPALMPAVVLGSVWTFNMFNIIYLVSGGEPDGSTEILISEAYKWAFERNEQYGYAAAYAVLIFVVLIIFNSFNQKILRTNT